MKKTIYGFVITLLVMTGTFGACNSHDETASTKNNSSEMMQNMNHDEGGMDHGNSTGKKVESADFSDQRNSRTAAIIDAFEQTKSGLDASDKTKTAEGAKTLLAAFEKFDATSLNESQRSEYKEIYESAKEHAEHIVKSELDHQKEHFESLTTDMKDLLGLVNNDK